MTPHLHEHELVFLMSGPPWRDDDTPVENHDDLRELMGFPRLDTLPDAEASDDAPPPVRKKRRDAGQPRTRKAASVTRQGR